MSAPLNDVPPPPSSTSPWPSTRPSPVRTLVSALVVVVAGGALGAAGGWLWWQWWSPGPEGQVIALPDGGTTWVPRPAESGYTALFDATMQYAVLGVGLGAVVGLLAVVLCRRRELIGLASAALGSVIGAVVMWQVGTAQSPPDPETLIDGAQVGDVLPGALEVSGWTAYLGWPVGALTVFVIVLLLVIDRPEPPPHS